MRKGVIREYSGRIHEEIVAICFFMGCVRTENAGANIVLDTPVPACVCVTPPAPGPSKLPIVGATSRVVAPEKPLWKATSTNGNMASPAIANDRVYFGQGNGWLYVFDALCQQQNCQPLWISNTIYSIYGSPLIANGLVFVTSASKQIFVYKDEQVCSHPNPANPNICNELWKDSLANMSISSHPL